MRGSAITGNLGWMKALLAVILILLLLVVAFPIGMGEMGAMGHCPMCTSPDTHVALGICAALLSLAVLIVLLASSRLHLTRRADRRFLVPCSIYRPPRLV